MGRPRRDGTTKVWHNPDISGRRPAPGAPKSTPSLEDRKTQNAHRAALEALFAPKKEEDTGKVQKAIEAATGKPGRIVLAPPPQADPRAQDRQRLLGKLLAAEGRPAITKAANEFFKHGFTLPQEQDVYLQLLEHTNEDRVREAIDKLASILLSELPKRRTVLESRLRRIEELAEDTDTRTAAADLRRQVAGRGVAPSARNGATSTPLPRSSTPSPAPVSPTPPPVATAPASPDAAPAAGPGSPAGVPAPAPTGAVNAPAASEAPEVQAAPAKPGGPSPGPAGGIGGGGPIAAEVP
ncbi:MAG: hypothetical protein R3B70_41085 [Polyangiaceae bacterium]